MKIILGTCWLALAIFISLYNTHPENPIIHSIHFGVSMICSQVWFAAEME